jgi:hypothetical protein
MSAAHFHRRACAVLVTAMAVVAAAAGPSHAAGGSELLVDLAGDGEGFVHTTDEPWLDVDDLAPGSVRTRDLVVWNRTDRPADLRLLVTDLVDDENGCIRPELRVPGEECDVDGGELSSWLTLDLVAPDVGASGQRTLADLAADPAGLTPMTVGAGEQLPLTLRLGFLEESGNDTMTDQVGFDLRLDAAMAAAPPEVLGEEERLGGSTLAGPRIAAAGIGFGDSGGLGRAVALPLTGATLPLWVVLLDLLVLVAGGALVVLGRRARRRHPAFVG